MSVHLALLGILAMTRALGDARFKENRYLPPRKQIVTGFPDVQSRPITSEDEFLILATDGRVLTHLPKYWE